MVMRSMQFIWRVQSSSVSIFTLGKPCFLVPERNIWTMHHQHVHPPNKLKTEPSIKMVTRTIPETKHYTEKGQTFLNLLVCFTTYDTIKAQNQGKPIRTGDLCFRRRRMWWLQFPQDLVGLNTETAFGTTQLVETSHF